MSEEYVRIVTFHECQECLLDYGLDRDTCPLCSGDYTQEEWREACLEKIREAGRKAGKEAQERIEKHIIEILKSENKENQDA